MFVYVLWWNISNYVAQYYCGTIFLSKISHSHTLEMNDVSIFLGVDGCTKFVARKFAPNLAQCEVAACFGAFLKKIFSHDFLKCVKQAIFTSANSSTDFLIIFWNLHNYTDFYIGMK